MFARCSLIGSGKGERFADGPLYLKQQKMFTQFYLVGKDEQQKRPYNTGKSICELRLAANHQVISGSRA